MFLQPHSIGPLAGSRAAGFGGESMEFGISMGWISLWLLLAVGHMRVLQSVRVLLSSGETEVSGYKNMK